MQGTYVRKRCSGFLVATFLMTTSASASAERGADLDFLPHFGGQEDLWEEHQTVVRSSFTGRCDIEESLIFTDEKFPSVTFPIEERTGSWTNRVKISTRGEYAIAPGVILNFANRLDVQHFENDSSGVGTVVHHLREGYIAWAASNAGIEDVFVDLGRINVKYGTGYGFSPTDYFRRYSVPLFDNANPRELREGRLGTVMLRAQFFQASWSLSAIATPGFGDGGDAWWGNGAGWALELDRTNRDASFEIRYGRALSSLSVDLSYFRQGLDDHIGIAATYGVGNSWVAYTDYVLQRRYDLVTQSYLDLVRAGVVSADTPSVLPLETERRWRHQIVIGASYSFSAEAILNLEWHLNEVGFDRNDLAQWFGVSEAVGSIDGVNDQLWAIRDTALERQEPFLKQQLFARLSINDVLTTGVNMQNILFLSILDESATTQTTFTYAFQNGTQIQVEVSTNLGAERTAFGSLPVERGAAFRLKVPF